MAATESTAPSGISLREDRTAAGCSLLLAALALPILQVAHADTPPDRGHVSYKYLDYEDFQPGWDRMLIQANALSALLPIAGKWALEGALTVDTISGASPSYHSQRLRSAEVKDERRGLDFGLTRYFDHGSFNFSLSNSSEHDYESNAYSATGSISTESKNTTLTLGVGKTDDSINVPFVGVNNEPKGIYQGLLGITQVVTPRDIAQLTLTYSSGEGYFSDPYKLHDKRPDTKRISSVLARWNHRFEFTKGTARASYRYYSDTFDVRAHTATLEYVQPLPHDWTMTPFVRLYAQSAAEFYLDPVNPPSPVFVPRNQLQSQDQRLSAFGAGSLGIKISKYLTGDLLLDARYERYEQRGDWYPFGEGSPGIDPFKANVIQVGVTWYF